jgi:hypothetical protein
MKGKNMKKNLLIAFLAIALLGSLASNLSYKVIADVMFTNNGECSDTDILAKIRQHAANGRTRIELYNVHLVPVEGEDDALKATVVGTDEVDY